jgi:hypothetical protein
MLDGTPLLDIKPSAVQTEGVTNNVLDLLSDLCGSSRPIHQKQGPM